MQKSQNKTLLLFFGFILFAQTGFAACNLYPDLEKKISNSDPNRLACLDAAHFLLPRPEPKTEEQLIAGPISDEPLIKTNETVYCRYVYKYQNGSSNKFRCYHTDSKNVLINEKGQLVPEAASVADMQVGTKLEEDVMIDHDGKPITVTAKDGSQKLVRADVLKVRYKYSIADQKTQSPAMEWRHREAFTSTVASRLAWVMGLPSEYYYPTKEVVCLGCDKDPWKNSVNPQPEPVNETNIFPFASIERKFDGKRIIKAFTSDPKLGKTFTNVPWTWYEYLLNFKNLTPEQQHELQVVVLFINLMHTFEERGGQHVLLCEKAYLSEDKKSCSQPLAGTHDLGSAFGNRASSFAKNGDHPRGDYEAYKVLNMFRDNQCTLGAQPGRPADIKGDGILKKVSDAALKDFLSRMELVSKKDLMTILKIANFQDVDLPFKASVGKKTGLKDSELDEKTLELWADLIYSKMEQYKNVQCPSEAVIVNDYD